MSDTPVASEEINNDAEPAAADFDTTEDTRASIVFALMQFNRTAQDLPYDSRNDFIEVIKASDCSTWPAGALIIEKGSPADRLYLILEGAAEADQGDGAAAAFEKGAIVGHRPLVTGEPFDLTVTASDKGVTLLAIQKETLIRYPVVYRSLLGRGLVIKGGSRDYELGDKLGEGYNGPVFEIQGHSLCAKIYRGRHDSGSAPPDAIPEHIVRLQHPNIVSLFETVSDHGAQYVIMDIASGISIRRAGGEPAHCRTLRQMLDVFHAEQQRVTLDMTAKIFRHVASALLYIHGQGLVHRDVKPEHIFIDICDNDISYKLSDFSLAFPISTRPGKIVGTPHYCPPEAIDFDRPDTLISGSADFYSLAAVCFELLTDQTVFDCTNVLDLAQQHLDAEPDLSRLPSDTPIWLGKFIEQSLQKDPARRPLSTDIEKFISVA